MFVQRDFFRQLGWRDNYPHQYYPFFNDYQISSLPLKWLKHLTLVQVGLRNEEDLYNEILRFSKTKNRLRKIKQKCNEVFKPTDDNPHLIVLKIISNDKTMALPNYRLFGRNEIDSSLQDIKTKYNNSDEIWLCKSDVSEFGQNLGGRLSLTLNNDFQPNILEIIWNTSPRLIDSYSSISKPYLLAYKYPGSLQYKIEKSFIPEDHNVSVIENSMIKDLIDVISRINDHQQMILEFTSILTFQKVKECILEFKIDNGKFQFIDWDTETV